LIDTAFIGEGTAEDLPEAASARKGSEKPRPELTAKTGLLRVRSQPGCVGCILFREAPYGAGAGAGAGHCVAPRISMFDVVFMGGVRGRTED